MKSNIDVQNREYLSVLNEIKNEILSSRINTARKVNRDLIKLYWKIGELLYNKVLDLGWGKSIVQNLSIDLQKEYPQTTGYSPDNLWRMKQFYSEYSNNEFMEQLVPEMKKLQKTKTNTKIMEQLVSEVEFSLKTKSNPIGVVEYKLYKDIPEEMKGKLPSIEDFKRIKG